jgi:glycosyltransferase involved in cell wall biosynthesis
MQSYSIIVTAYNMERVIGRTLQSAEAAVRMAHQQAPESGTLRGEIVVVDDGSSDQTWQRIHEQAAGKPFYQLIRRLAPSSPSHARNVGVDASHGALLFFLDGDDLYYPDHVQTCLAALTTDTYFVKTKVHLADPVHPDWKERIDHSLVLNLCVRRACHEAVGGFPDWHLCVRAGEGFRSVTDIFYKFEDMYYNELITRSFKGIAVRAETVEYMRYPGNGFDQQYARYQHPFGTPWEPKPEEQNFRLGLCDVILQHRLYELRGVSD